MAFAPLTDEQYEAGLALGRRRLAKSAVALSVRYDGTADRVVVSLGKCDVSVPRATIGEFTGLSAEDMAFIRLSAVGDAIAVGSGDIHVDLAGLLADVLPEAALSGAVARQRSRETSSAQARVARLEGRTGGRSRKAVGSLIRR